MATLLLAMGVGVLIGHNTDSGTQRAAAPVQVLTVGGGAGVANTGNAGAAGPGTKVSTKGKKIKPTIIKLNPKVKQAANQAAGKVLGNSNNLVKDSTVQPGQSCSGGAGCENGQFTGNFFSGG